MKVVPALITAMFPFVWIAFEIRVLVISKFRAFSGCQQCVLPRLLQRGLPRNFRTACGLRVGYGDYEGLGKSLKSGTFPRGQLSRIFRLTLIDENFAPVLIVLQYSEVYNSPNCIICRV